jgi:hypothetical protein
LPLSFPCIKQRATLACAAWFCFDANEIFKRCCITKGGAGERHHVHSPRPVKQNEFLGLTVNAPYSS